MIKTNLYYNLLAQADKVFRHTRQGSFKTRERYFKAYKRFLAYVAETYRLQKIANVSEKHLRSYVENMQEQGLSPATIKTDLAAIRFFYDQIPAAKHELPPNETFELERRTLRGKDRTWTDQEFAYIVAQASKKGREDIVTALHLARYMGLRIHEVFKVDRASAQAALKTGELTVKGKGGLVRKVPLHPSVEILFRKMLAVTQPGQKLLVPPDQKTHNAIKELQQFIADTRPPQQDGQPHRAITFHGLRHNYASENYKRMIEEGCGDGEARQQISRWMGHKRIEIVEVYLASVKQEGAVM